MGMDHPPKSVCPPPTLVHSLPPANTFRTATFWSAPISNFAFLATFSGALYFHAICMIYDPGFVPKPSGLNEQKRVIEELIKEWKYDDRNFCTLCMLRMPLRSKHCRRCDRCVAKHDQ